MQLHKLTRNTLANKEEEGRVALLCFALCLFLLFLLLFFFFGLGVAKMRGVPVIYFLVLNFVYSTDEKSTAGGNVAFVWPPRHWPCL